MSQAAKKSSTRTRPARSKVTEEPDVRVRILRASRTLIEREGLSALSMREVARRAGVSHQAPYNHFPDREAILGALAEEGFVMLRDQLATALQQAVDAPARIREGSRAYVEFAIRHPAHFRLMFRPELVDLENCPGAKAEGDETFRLFTQVVEDLVGEGLPSAADLDALIALGWSVCHGLACLILDGPLARKLPHAERDSLVSAVCEAFASLLRVGIEANRKKTR